MTEEILRPALPGEVAMPTHEDFIRVSNEYWQKQAEASTAAASETPVGVSAIVCDDLQSGLMADLESALDHDILKPVVWPAAVPVDHKLRKIPFFVRLWSGPEWNEFWSLYNAKPVPPDGSTPETQTETDKRIRGINQTFWYVIAISACDASGKSIWDYMKTCAEYNAANDGPVQMSQLLKLKYDGPKGSVWTDPVWNQAMIFNGLFPQNDEAKGNLEAKNSDSTTSSTSSDVSSV